MFANKMFKELKSATQIASVSSQMKSKANINAVDNERRTHKSVVFRNLPASISMVYCVIATTTGNNIKVDSKSYK